MTYRELVQRLNAEERKAIFRYEATPNEDVVTVYRMKSELFSLVKGKPTPIRFGKMKYLSDTQHAMIWKMIANPVPSWYQE